MKPGQKHLEKSKRLLSESTKRAHAEGKLSKAACFKSGHKPWNKGLPLNLNPKTTFKKGQYAGKKHPFWKGGTVKTKADCTHIWLAPNKYGRRPRLVYEKYHGRIPKGYVIYHLDGNNGNDHPSNLEAISRKELRKRNLITGRWSKKR